MSNPLVKLNQAKAKKERRLQACKAFAACLFLTMLAASLSIHYQVTFTSTTIEVTDDDEPTQEELAGPATFDEIFASVALATASAAPAEPVQKATIRLNASTFDASFVTNASHQAYVDEAPRQHASLPPVVVQPKPEIKTPQVWTASLRERQAIARNYLTVHCPNLLQLEAMQTAQSKMETDARFMAAKSPRGVVGSLVGELRAHNIVVGQMCSKEFYAKLFPQKQ